MVIFWTLVILSIISFIQYHLFKRFVLRHVHYERKFKQDAVFANEPCQLIEKIENRKRLLIPWLYVESLLDAHLTFGKQENLFVSSGTVYQNHASFFVLKGYNRITRTHRLIPIKRGVYYLQSVTLTSGDLLGFAKQVQHRQLHDQKPLIVYPDPQLPSYHMTNDDFSLGDTVVKRFMMPDPFMTAGIRQYVPGDAFKHINWQATARTHSLQVNQYDYTSNKKLMVLINCEDNENMWKTVTNTDTIEQLIRYAAGITKAALEQGYEAGIATNMHAIDSSQPAVIHPIGGQSFWFVILEHLARLKIERAISFNALLESFVYDYTEPTVFIVLSCYWSEEQRMIAQQLIAKQHQLQVVSLADHYSSKLENEGAKR